MNPLVLPSTSYIRSGSAGDPILKKHIGHMRVLKVQLVNPCPNLKSLAPTRPTQTRMSILTVPLAVRHSSAESYNMIHTYIIRFFIYDSHGPYIIILIPCICSGPFFC